MTDKDYIPYTVSNAIPAEIPCMKLSLRKLEHIANALYTVGNDKLADDLMEIKDNMQANTSVIENNCKILISNQFDIQQESFAKVLKACLGEGD